jgi:DNA invertase Pin-like site-specific DNA recombinase
MPAATNAPLAVSYIRFSSVQQAAGDSLRRQLEATHAWCERNGVRLDESLSFRDLGRSAFFGKHRENPDRHALAAFLKMVQDGRVARGSYLVIESLDRLTREHVRAGLMLLLGLIEAGIRIVQLSPSELVYDEKSDEMGLMLAIVELSRGHRESKRKSDLIKSVWAKRKQRARDREAYAGMLPAWIEERGGKLELIPQRAAVVRRIFELTIGGYGLSSIVRKFAAEGVPTFGEVHVREGRKRSQFSGRWNRAYLSRILRDRRAVGEFQPCRREGHKKIPEGGPIPGYFPAVVTEGEWLAARAAAAGRRSKPGRIGANVNFFSGLIRHARDGDSYFLVTRSDGRRGLRASRQILINMRSTEGDAPGYSFPLEVFERAILSMLREIDPREILGKGEADGPDEVLVLSGQLARVESSIALIAAEMDAHGESPALFKRLRAKEEEQRDLARRLGDARQRAASPLSEAWGECQSLLAALDDASDPHDARLRLRSALRRILQSIWLLVVPRGRDRLAAVRVQFADHGRAPHRDYLILHRPPTKNARGGKPGSWWARSLADVVALGPLDLRNPEHARKLEAALAARNLDAPAS